ncbi:MAG: competence protein CoiA family protein, partial [Bacteroidales bacterium]|nr:competence protein CoiA family protein [Bacteroidales bacterium]
MKQLLIVSKKKVLRTYAEGILLPYDGADGDALKEWVSARYNMSVVKTQMIAKTDIVVLTVVEKQHCVQGEYISVAKAIELIDRENEPLHNYLNSLREEFDIQLEYGVKNGRIINIMDLPLESKGLQCDCVCPGCGGRLIARKGAKKKHHFAHYNEPCNLVAAQQTALHMLAKEIIEEEKRFLFPGYSVSRKEVEWEPDYQPYDYYQMPELQYREPYRAKCESVTLERKISDFVPDIIVSVRGKIC